MTLASARFEPAARSRHPAEIRSIAPRASRMITVCCFATFIRLLGVKKFSLANPQMIIMTIKIINKLYFDRYLEISTDFFFSIWSLPRL